MTVAESKAVLEAAFPFVLVFAAIAVLLYVARRLYRELVRSKFEGEYSVNLPVGVSVKKLKAGIDGSVAARDFASCRLYLDGYVLECGSLPALRETRAVLRSNGHIIPNYPRKAADAARRGRVGRPISVEAVVSKFKSDPAGFERFCAALFGDMGWDAEVTPKTNDGGYDIKMRRRDGLSCIVECKCYSPDNPIGRPALQKLVGANATIRAGKMMFVTTSRFSDQAKEYARTVGIELIDGKALKALIDKRGMF